MKVKVIKIGGKLIENGEVLSSLCDSLASLDGKFVLVHGGGVMGSRLAEQLGVEVKMHEGRRITDAATLDIAVMAYAGLANKRVVAALQSRGVNACGLSGCDMAIVNACVDQVKSIAPFKNVYVTRAGCTISSHCGKNTLGVLFIRK